MRMKGFARATTPTFTLTVKDKNVDLTQVINVYATFEQNAVKITKTGTDLEVEEKVVKCWLTQEESLSLSVGSLDVQVNWTYYDNNGNVRRGSTDTCTIVVTSQLLAEILDETTANEATAIEVTDSDST